MQPLFNDLGLACAWQSLDSHGESILEWRGQGMCDEGLVSLKAIDRLW